jgi:CubicO group peptidase (beta-lactamase class C family)
MSDRKSGLPVTRRQLLSASGAVAAATLLPAGANAAAGLDPVIREQMARAYIPGLAVGVARDGRVTFARGYGHADLARRRLVTRDTMFHIASITKTVTGLAVMRLVEDGLIRLDDPVAPHLDFTIAGGDWAATITFRHLLMHMSGISDEVYYQVDFRTLGTDSQMPLERLLRDYLAPGGRYTGTGNVRQVPGMGWDYSNIGFALLGYLVGRIAGEDMRAFTRARLFAPLCLRHIAWSIADTPERLRATPYELVDGTPRPVAPVGFPDWPAGMIRASIHDLTLLVSATANAGKTQETRLLNAANTAEMLAMHRPAGLPGWLTGQGLAWQQSMLDGSPRANHWGGDPGVFTMAYVDPDRRAAVVILSNLSDTQQSRSALKVIAAHALQTAPR